jgi:peroxiredoxin
MSSPTLSGCNGAQALSQLPSASCIDSLIRMEPLDHSMIAPWLARVSARSHSVLFSLLTGCLALGFGAGAQAQEASLKWNAANVQSNLSGFSPQRLTLSDQKPARLKKAPKDLKNPRYGELRIGPKESPAALVVLLDEAEGQSPRFFIDSNNNGDLTDDASVKWEQRTSPGPGGKDRITYNGDATVKIPYPGGARDAHLIFYRFAKNDEQGAQFKDYIFYYRDYALAGKVKLGDKSYSALLVDENVTGDFRGAAGKSSGISFFVDISNDGKFDPRRELFDIRAPFNIGGTTYEIADITADGRLKISKSSKSAVESKPAPNLSKGATVPSFTAKTMDGKEIKFPQDYKGKVVLIDFWATWYGPCVREIPNMVASYEKFHDQGFEILGISLDRENFGDQISAFTAEKKMTWPQVYEGKQWETEIGKLYDIHSPGMFLVNGSTGEILGGVEARGPNLQPAIESALAKMNASKKPAK